ncbi:hypothetical protein PTSG_08589 [Salpingoeca rosetta]|uniref:Uncharacterized protein n=1 Tax=Salpingoeca rosetta (strain ATCC 50818 / BSB-021) TaxID=946362 RepID=F2UK43_SALR5|nr:uncharacterized protein PTSG_08589 [Salpingoeca rosetta]EGD77492.1 hypothetical protein PTSG_08589 [Salpingoeca rosetta]|eukprot:XP_004990380.1 hypothetical protein PTSG_08589 [Salpingoeca rosetta]
MLVSRMRMSVLALVALLALNVYVFVERSTLEKQLERQERAYDNSLNIISDCREQLKMLVDDRNKLRKERREVVVEENGLLLKEQAKLETCQEELEQIKGKDMHEAVFNRAVFEARRRRSVYLHDSLAAIQAVALMSGRTPGSVLGEDPDDEMVRNTLIAATASRLQCDVARLQALPTPVITEVALGLLQEERQQQQQQQEGDVEQDAQGGDQQAMGARGEDDTAHVNNA